MYTQCPECQIAFRVTARVLQQAGGKVRCGDCGNAFNALDYLSEEMPDSAPNEDAAPVEASSDDKLEETSRRLLETLDQLAGPEEVRIEDTGVEWRVLSDADEAIESENLNDPSDTGSIYVDEHDMANAASSAADPEADQDSLDLQRQETEERRYDDNTPLPDDFDGDEEYSYQPPPKRRHEDDKPDTTEFDELQGDLALSEPGEWTELLDEVADADAIPLEVEEELAAIHSQLSVRATTRPPSTVSTDDRESDGPGVPPEDLDTQFEMQAEALGITGTQEILAEDTQRNAEDDLTDEVPLLQDTFAVAASDDESKAAEIEISADDFDDAAAADDIEDIRRSADNLHDDDSFGAPNEDDAPSPDEYVIDEDDYADEDIDDEIEEGLDESDTSADSPVDEHEQADSEQARIIESSGEFEAEIDVADQALAEDGRRADDSGEIEVELDIEETLADELITDVEQIGADSTEEPIIELDVPASGSRRKSHGADEAADIAAQQTDDDDRATIVFGADHASKFFDENSGEVETIVMEGEFVRAGIEKQQLAADRVAQANIKEASKLADTYALNREKIRGGRRSYDPPSYVMIVALVGLTVALLAQIVHASRDSLATSNLFNQTVAPVYRLLGQPITPQWDIKGWQFEATNGSTNENQDLLTVVSRIANNSAVPLPYPLVHVSLTDRWEEIIGSKVLEPNEYLAGDLDPSKPVTPGENFTAVISIRNPSQDATGFKLNVCYRVAPGRVRCAIEDFKN